MSAPDTTPADTTAPTCWPGTTIVKSQHNAFNWRTKDHSALSVVAAEKSTACTPLYNEWRAARAEHPATTADWHAYRDAFNAMTAAAQATRRLPSNRTRKPTGGSGGFQATGGTLYGLSARTAKMLQPKPNLSRVMSTAAPLMPITPVTKPMHVSRARAPAQKAPLQALAQASHNGAYSRAAAGKASSTNPKGSAT